MNRNIKKKHENTKQKKTTAKVEAGRILKTADTWGPRIVNPRIAGSDSIHNCPGNAKVFLSLNCINVDHTRLLILKTR